MLFVPLTLSEPEITPEIVNIIISRASRYISHPGPGTIHILHQQLGLDSRVVRAGGSLRVMQFTSSPVFQTVCCCLFERESFAEYKNNRCYGL